MAISCTVMAAGSLFVNLCWPTRMIYILLYPHPTSPIFWDMVNITTYFAISLAYAYLSTRVDLVRVMHENPRFAWLYRILAMGYTDVSPEARRRDQTILRILAGIVLVTEGGGADRQRVALRTPEGTARLVRGGTWRPCSLCLPWSQGSRF